MWQTGSATDYFDLLYQLRQVVTARHVATAAVNAGGAGYVVGDTLTVLGGTNTHVADLEVTSVAAGVVTGVRITNAGAYSVDPTTTANAVTGGTGAGCTIDLTMAETGWTVLRESVRALSATIASGGTGYAVNDEIEIQGGLGIGVSNNVEAATFIVDAVSGGVVTAVSVKAGSEGNYEETPSNPVLVLDTAGGGNNDCTLNVTYESRVPDDHSILALEGAATSFPDPVQVGIKTHDAVDGIFDSRNWVLFGFAQAWSDATLFHQHPGISPGMTTADTGVIASIGAVVLLKDNDGGGSFPLDFYMSVTDRRIMMAVRCNTATIDAWVTCYLGFTNQFGTTDELPYPVLIAGSCDVTAASILNISISPVKTSIVHCVSGGLDDDARGPALMLTPDGFWRQITTGTLTSGNAFLRASKWTMAPCSYPTSPSHSNQPGYDLIAGSDFNWEDVIDLRQAIAPAFPMWPTPDTTLIKQYMLFPVTVVVGTGNGTVSTDNWYPFGELDGVFWFSYMDGGAGADALDFMDVGTDRYRVFRAAHRAELANDFFVFRED